MTKIMFKKPSRWHTIDLGAVFIELSSQADGLTQAEAERRFVEFSPNRLRPTKKRSSWVLLANQFKNILIYVLLIAAGITAFIGHWVDAAVIAGVVLINALIGFVQEGKVWNVLEKKGINKQYMLENSLLSPATCCLVNPDREKTVEKAFKAVKSISKTLKMRYELND